MPYTANPATSATDRVRLHVGDINDDIELLSDAEYQYYLTKYNGSERRAALDAARAILFKITRYSRQRTGDIEVYGAEWFKNYRDALMMMLTNPELTIAIPVPYAGGISTSDMQSNADNSDNVAPQMYIGFRSGVTTYQEEAAF